MLSLLITRVPEVGFRQMMQFWNPLIMRYHAHDKALAMSLLLERRIDACLGLFQFFVDFSSFGVGRRMYFVMGTNVGFRQMQHKKKITPKMQIAISGEKCQSDCRRSAHQID